MKCPTIAIFLLCVTSAFCRYEDCGSKEGALRSIAISDCNLESDDECILERGSDATIEIALTNVNAESVQARVHGDLGDFPIPFPLPEPDGCNSGIQCPVKSDDVNNYKNSLPVLKSYPRLSVTVEWQLVDEKGDTLICVKIPAKIK